MNIFSSHLNIEPRRIPAWLYFDSLQRPLALGIRSGQPAVRQLLFKAENYDLDMRITPAGADWRISGQLLGPEPNGQVELRRAADRRDSFGCEVQHRLPDRSGSQGVAGMVQAELNDLGEFSLPPASPGIYSLILHLGNLEVELLQLEMGA